MASLLTLGFGFRLGAALPVRAAKWPLLPTSGIWPPRGRQCTFRLEPPDSGTLLTSHLSPIFLGMLNVLAGQRFFDLGAKELRSQRGAHA